MRKLSLKLLVAKVLGKVPLGTVLIVPFLVQIVGTVGLVGYLSFRSGQKAVETLIMDLGEEVSDRIEQNVLSFLDKPHLLLQTTLGASKSGKLNLDDFQQLQCSFLAQVQQPSSFNHLGFGNEKGELLSVEHLESAIGSEIVVKVKDESTGSQRITYGLDHQCNRTELLKKKKYDPRSRDWYKAAVAAEKPTWSPLYRSVLHQEIEVSASAPVYSQAGELLGVFYSELTLSAITDFLDNLTISPSGQAFIIECSGEMVASTLGLPFDIAQEEEPEQLEAIASNQPLIRATAQKLLEQFGSFNQIKEKGSFALDPLTDLPNRALFLERLEQAINRAKRRSDYLFAVLFLDCDRFKIVNDSLGHLRGDQLLIAVARRLESCLRSIDMLARFGGDEFAILLEEIEDIHDATTAAKRFRKALSLPFPIDRHTLFFNASIGIVLGTKEYEHPEALLRDADTAMYQAKKLSQAGYQVFDSEMHARARRNLSLETDLKLAMARKDFVLYYQPLLELTTGCLTGFEVLLRWIHPEQGLISPVEFIPLAEETGLIVPMGMWVLREACHQLQTWQNQGLAQSPVKLSVNLSAKQFLQPDLVEQIDQILAETQLDSSSLKLEITESAFADNDRWAGKSLQRLRNRQIQLLIDDFGTGYSSLSYLHRFPVDGLKIDRSFIRPLSEDGRHLKIVQALVSLAHHLDLSVTAEGIETTQQLAQLRALGCSEGQGYFLSQPLPPSEAEAFLADEQYKYHTSPTL